MTKNTYTRIQFQNAITERQRSADDRAAAAELVTPFTIVPGTPIFDVTIRPSTEPDELIMVLGLYGGTIEQRIMPQGAYTYQLAQAYAANAQIKTIGIN